MNRRPAGHEPRGGPGFSVRFPDGVDTLILEIIGIQAANRETVADPVQQVLSLTQLPNGPHHLERGWFTNSHGGIDEVIIAYWLSPQTHDQWTTDPLVRQWWDQVPVDGVVGHWREQARIPVNRFETLHSAPLTGGLATVEPVGETLAHDYWGAARDRIPASESDSFAAEPEGSQYQVSLPTTVDSKGKRVQVVPPHNVCLIRTAQDWEACDEEQSSFYLTEIEPHLRAGSDFLSSNPTQTHCRSSRYLSEVDTWTGAPTERTCVLAWWDTLGDMERWVEEHPTHKAIYGSFWGMAMRYGPALRLHLWHEVAVLPAGACRFEYVNCHSDTGLLTTHMNETTTV